MTDATERPRLVRVFREHPEWDKASRWFLMRADLLAELHVKTYQILDSEDWDLDESHPCIVAIRADHPGAVLVY